MKKVILALIFFLNIITFAKQYSENEKKEILKQFSELQTSVKTKNRDKLFDYINFPVYSPTASAKYTKAEMKKIYDIPFYYTDLLKISTETTEVTPVEDYPVFITENGGIEYVNITADFINKNNVNAEMLYHFFPEYDGNGFLVIVTAGNDSYGSSNYYIFDLINKKLKLTAFFQIP